MPFFALLIGCYLLTVSVETAVLLIGLSRLHSWKRRLFAGAWLTACTYPIVWLVLPGLFPERWMYLVVAETFAPVAECVLFWLAFLPRETWNRRVPVRDLTVVVLANLASFAVGEVLIRVRPEWFELK